MSHHQVSFEPRCQRPSAAAIAATDALISGLVGARLPRSGLVVDQLDNRRILARSRGADFADAPGHEPMTQDEKARILAGIEKRIDAARGDLAAAKAILR